MGVVQLINNGSIVRFYRNMDVEISRWFCRAIIRSITSILSEKKREQHH